MMELDLEKIPHHVAIIMDGNRRWARESELPVPLGHWRGADTLSEIVQGASDLGVKVLTVYAFSTENWNRPEEEVRALMELFKTYLKQEQEEMVRNGVRLHTIGELGKLPIDVREVLEESCTLTAKGTKIDLVLAINYGARNEIVRAVGALVDACQKGEISRGDVNEKTLSSLLDTARWPDPDLLIRTGGECRLSNFLLWQLSYAEVYLTEVMWPDFSTQDFRAAIIAYQKRNRRQGG